MRQDVAATMPNLFTDYPAVPWKQGWAFSSSPDDSISFITGAVFGALTLPDARWILQLLPVSESCSARLFSNGFSICIRKNPKKKRIDALILEPGVLAGSLLNLPYPSLNAPNVLTDESGLSWVGKEHHTTLLLCKEERFALVSGEFSKEQALRKAEDALDEKLEPLIQTETERRGSVVGLFSMNPRHNPPVALAAESLIHRLRERTPFVHGLWSAADGFEDETFSLNELYALVRAWTLIEPATAMELTHTALSLQQSNGGFPAWVNRLGIVSTAAPWPMIIQTFERAWAGVEPDPKRLKQTLPALRKYIQWALRRFDPHRDGIPSWQSDQEVFIPGSFERDKATPELTVMLLGEIEALLRLCEKNHDAETAIESLTEQRDQLAHTLTSIFWNPEKKSFSNVWKNGHFTDEPSFGSFLPLLWKNLGHEHRTPLLESFEETHGFPGHIEPASWKQEEIDDTAHLPAIHQFMAFEALRQADSSRALLLLFVRRAREGFAAWFERESIEAARMDGRRKTEDGGQRSEVRDQKSETPKIVNRQSSIINSPPAPYALGPVTASLILTTQQEFQHEAGQNAPVVKQLLHWVHRFRFTRTDLRTLTIFGLAILLVHLLYNPKRTQDTDARIAEAAVNYKQGQLTQAIQICRAYPDHPLSRFLKANLMMLAENPSQAEELYHLALRQETGSPSALFGYALALQMNGKYKDAVHRYNDFIDIYEGPLSKEGQEDLVDLAYEFLRLADAEFSKPPRWKRVYTHAIMNDLGL